MRILAVEPDNSVLQSLEIMLGSEGFNVYGTQSGEEALELGKLYDYDAITLELSMPDVSGYDIIRRLRDSKIHTPILVVSGIDDIDNRVKALRLGADDYMTKPFHKDELIARINAIVRRSKGHAQSIITVGAIAVNIDSNTVTVHGSPVHLTGKEFKTVELLALRKGQVQSKESLMNYLYGGMDEPEAKIVDVFVCKLRKKLAAAGADGSVETVRGRGYLMRDHSEMAGAA